MNDSSKHKMPLDIRNEEEMRFVRMLRREPDRTKDAIRKVEKKSRETNKRRLFDF